MSERPIHTTTEDPMGDDSGVITHPTFRMWLRPDGIVQMVMAQRATMALEDAVALVEAITQLTGGRRRPLMMDLHDSGLVDRLARLELARRGDVVSAVALIVGTPLSRMMGSFFLSVNKPTFPTRLFDNEVSAVTWLLEFDGRP